MCEWDLSVVVAAVSPVYDVPLVVQALLLMCGLVINKLTVKCKLAFYLYFLISYIEADDSTILRPEQFYAPSQFD